MSFTQFIKPYPDGYIDGEAGDTPVTAEILNTNYDGFLLALNSWASDVENDIGDAKTDITGLQGSIGNIQSALSDKVDTSTFNQLGETVRQIGIAVNGKSTVSISDLLQSGTKVATLTIDGTAYDLYAPSGGGGGSSVTWNQIISTGTKIAEIEIDGVTTDVYAPSGSGTGGHTIIDENGNSMTARAGLQFVGGANVSDDATNDKTIVDLASAGGIDGVFVDTDNVIFAQTTDTDGTFDYTATQDCVAFIRIANGAVTATVTVDNVSVFSLYSTNANSEQVRIPIYLKKGQNLKLANGRVGDNRLSVYGIQTGTTHSKFQPVIYSTEEREIGVWEDGKPIYQKTWVFSSELTISQSSFTDTSIDSTDIENIVKVEAIHDDGTCFEGTLADPTKSNHTVLALQTSRNNNGASIKKLTLQYTKISDTAGSGTWTPQGVPAVHYSEDEQVIGTWFGETLYQKTLHISNVQFDSTGVYDLDLTSMGTDILIADNSCSYYTFSTYVRNFEKLVPEDGHIYCYGVANRPITDGYITIKYTKSS